MSERKLIFVYGTLKNKKVAETFGGKILQDAQIKGDMYDMGPFPGVVNIGDSDNIINGKLMEVYPPTLLLLDHYEGVASGLYKRKEVSTTEGTRVQVYEFGIDPVLLEARPLITLWPTKSTIERIKNAAK